MGAIYRQDSGKTIIDEKNVKGLLSAELGHIDLVRLTIEEHGSIDAHVLDIPVAFYVISGVGMAVIDGDEVTVEAGDILEVAPGEDRGWYNERHEPLELLAVKHKM